jgi:sucrose-6-phosphate hydrolase SacC (GH32 family)
MWGVLVFALLGSCKGLQLERQLEREDAIVDDVCTDENDAEIYREPRRPQFHFSATNNWINDPVGLLYHKGVYHLFFQENPHSNRVGEDAWGHAESSDLLHWEQVPDAIVPDSEGMIYSGSAVVDWHNTSGLQQEGLDPPMIAIYTLAARQGTSQRIAYSHDGGRVWTKVHKDVIPPFGSYPEAGHGARDPLVRWHKASNRWIMILWKRFLTETGPLSTRLSEFQLFGSHDLQDWKYLSSVEFEGAYECPDMFEMTIAGEPPSRTKWVVMAASGAYVVGDFDGNSFVFTGPVQRLEHGVAYAGQTFNEEPRGRRVQLSWLQPRKVDTRYGAFKNTAFTGAMSFPAEIELARIPGVPDGLRLRKRPVAELETLRSMPFHAVSRVLQPDAPLWVEEPAGQHGAGLEIRIRARIPRGQARLSGRPLAEFLFLLIGNEKIQFSTPTGTTEGTVNINEWVMPLAFEDEAIEICVLTDRTTIEIYDLIGGTSLATYHNLPCDGTEWKRHVAVAAKHAGTMIEKLDVYNLKSTLPKHPPREIHQRLSRDSQAGRAGWQKPPGNPDLPDLLD